MPQSDVANPSNIIISINYFEIAIDSRRWGTHRRPDKAQVYAKSRQYNIRLYISSILFFQPLYLLPCGGVEQFICFRRLIEWKARKASLGWERVNK